MSSYLPLLIKRFIINNIPVFPFCKSKTIKIGKYFEYHLFKMKKRRDMISIAIRQLLTEINDAPSHKTILKIPTRLILRDSTFPRTIRHKK